MEKREYIFCDASLAQNRASFAYIYLNTQNSIVNFRSGLIKDSEMMELSSVDAEMIAILNAIDHQRALGGKYLDVYTDCVSAMQEFRRKNQRQSFYKIRSIQNRGQIKLHHIKAHSGRQDMKSVLHRWCDRRARSISSRTLKGRVNLNEGGILMEHLFKNSQVTSHEDSVLWNCLNRNMCLSAQTA